MGRRRFGRVRRLPSGRWQARYRGPDGVDRPAPTTFARKSDADRWLARTEDDIIVGEWLDPTAGGVVLRDYGLTWIDQRPGLRPRTRELYEGLMRLHTLPHLGSYELAGITTPRVRSWHSDLVREGPGQVTAAKAYRLLRSVLNTAVEDRLIRSNPCQVKGAGVEHSAERPTLTVPQVVALAEAVPARFRVLVLLATVCSLRWGELAALTRADVDVCSGFVHVRRSVTELSDGRRLVGPPKSAAGRRVVAIPPSFLPLVVEHLAEYVASDADALVFIGPKGAPLRRANFQKHWRTATDTVGVAGLHFHDLRHTGNTLAAQAGATMSDLMARMGHASTRAARIYLHTTSDRDRVVAAELDRLFFEGSGT